MGTNERPLIILGAGASYDFVHPKLKRFRMLPVTNQLVESEYIDYGLLNKYEEAQDLFSRIAPAIIREDRKRSFEEILGDVTNQIQLVALRFYLSDYFSKLSRGDLSKESVNNYRGLLDHIRGSRAKGADIITFNYDTLLEQQFEKSRKFFEMQDYILPEHPIRIIKIHGSCDWFYIRRKDIRVTHANISNAFEYLKSDPNFVGDACYTSEYLQEFSSEPEFRIPAITIPTSKNKDLNFFDKLCLTDMLEKASRILIIGWKAGDPNLLELMKQVFKHKVSVFLVTGPSDAEEVKRKVAEVPNLEIAAEMKEGFSNFIESKMAKTFFG